MKAPVISVIVPVYKAEKYISHCIESILKQSFPDFELLLIDDGSPDNSGGICDQWTVKDERIHVFHQKNAGVSAARNKGLDEAQGEYIVFVDSDDYVLPDYLIELYKIQMSQSGVGLVVQSISCVSSDDTLLPSLSLQDVYISSLEMEKAFTENNICEMGFSGSKIYTRKIIEEYSIRFDETVYCLEDLLFMYKYLLHCDYLILNHLANYVYVRYNAFSLSSGIHSFESEYNCFMIYQELFGQMVTLWNMPVEKLGVTINSLLVPFRRALKSDYQPNRNISRKIRLEHLRKLIVKNQSILQRFYQPVFKTDKVGKILLISRLFALYDFYICLLFRFNIGPVFYGPKHKAWITLF